MDVACSRKGESISGDLAHAESVRLALRSFLAFFRATSADGRSRGAFEEDLQDLELCLCQCPIYQRPRKRRRPGQQGSTATMQQQQEEEAVKHANPAPLARLWEAEVIDM